MDIDPQSKLTVIVGMYRRLGRDARRLSLEAQEDLRRRAVAAVEAGHSQADVATVPGLTDIGVAVSGCVTP